MYTEEFIKNLGLTKKYKGITYILKIINETEYHTLFELNLDQIYNALAKIYNTKPENIKKDINYAKQQHLKNCPKAKLKTIFEINEPKCSTKHYIQSLYFAYQNNTINEKQW